MSRASAIPMQEIALSNSAISNPSMFYRLFGYGGAESIYPAPQYARRIFPAPVPLAKDAQILELTIAKLREDLAFEILKDYAVEFAKSNRLAENKSPEIFEFSPLSQRRVTVTIRNITPAQFYFASEDNAADGIDE